MNDDGNVLTWLVKYSLPKGAPAENATHYSLMGGKYEVPADKHDEWLQRYAAHLLLCPHVPLFFVERRTPFFRMHFDLDIMQPQLPALVDVIALVNVCSSVFRTFYPQRANDKQFVAIVLKSPPMAKNDVQKSGFHVIWPYMLVDQTQALTLRQACIVEAIKVLGEREAPCNSFDDVLDMCVFVENGLRMVYSDKTRQCELCKGKGKVHGNPCDLCREAKRVAENRVYRPYFVLDERGNLDPSRLEAITTEDKWRCVRACSIRAVNTTAATPGFERPSLVPLCDVATVMRQHNKQRRLQKAGLKPNTAAALARERGCKWLEGASEVDVKSGVAQHVEQFIQKSMGRPEWAEMMLQKLFYSATHKRYLAKVQGPGSQYCTNVHRCHGSATIFFVIESFGMVQRCYSVKKNDSGKACARYASTPVMLNRVLHSALFEEEEAMKPVEPEVEVTTFSTPTPCLTTPTPSVSTEMETTPVVGKVSAYLGLLPPTVVKEQQAYAQQGLQKLMQALEKKKGPAPEKKKGKNPFQKTKPVKAISQLTAPPTARTSDLILLDKQRATEQQSMIQQLRKDVTGASANKRAKRA